MEILGPTLSSGFGVNTLCQLTIHRKARRMVRALPVIICRDLSVCLDLQVHFSKWITLCLLLVVCCQIGHIRSLSILCYFS